MDFFFNPRGIAVIGATPNPIKGGNSIVRNLLATYQGGIYPVNPKYREIEGVRCFPSVQAIPDPVDLAIAFVAAPLVVQAVEDCIAKGVPGVMIESGGFAEIGRAGVELQKRLADLARKTGIRLWGPNCMGLVNGSTGGIFAFVMGGDRLKGNVLQDKLSLVVQSGVMAGTFLLDFMTDHVCGVSKACSIGNKVDVDECDLLPYLLADPDTNVVGLYLESIQKGRRFIEICRAGRKPIVVFKGGKSAKGARAAMSHTASLAGNSRVIEGVLDQAGVYQTDDFRKLIDLCRSLSCYPARPAGPQRGRIAILSFSGAAGIVSVDFMEQMDGSHINLQPAELSPASKRVLEKISPDWMPVNNPIDIWPAVEKNTGSDINAYGEALDALYADPAVDAVVVVTFTAGAPTWFDIPRAAAGSRASGKPVFIWVFGIQEAVLEFKEECRKNGIPVFRELHRALECLNMVFRERAEVVDLSTIEPAGPVFLRADLQRTMETMEGPLDEFVSKEILRSYGIPTVEEALVDKAGRCGEAAGRLGYPVVMKGLIPGGIHKTELGLVRLGIRNRSSALKAFRELSHQMEGRGKVVVQKQVAEGVELIAGLVRDPQFGPCVMFGLGGIMAEAFKDVVFAMAPLTRKDALNLIGRIKGQAFLDGFRGSPAVNRETLADVLIRLGEIGLACPRIREIDMNPLIAGPSGFTAVDATIVLGG